MEDSYQKQQRLYEIAEGDYAYTVWKKCRDEFTPAFHAFVDSQPEEIRNMLLGYADSGDMMGQRLVNLACERMDFTK